MPLALLPPTTYWFLIISAFAFGCCVGSYLNVVIYRLPLGLSTNHPRRSFCPLCKADIPFYQNIPLISWLMLGARCGKCKAPISARYPLVELMTGLMFSAAVLRFGLDWQVFAAFTFMALCVAGSYIDIDHQILPHEITWGGAAAGLVASLAIPGYAFLVPAQLPHPETTRGMTFLQSLGSAAAGYAVVWTVVQLGKLAFGKLKLRFDKPVEWSVTQPEGSPEPVLKAGDQEEVWSEIFSRRSDRLIIKATRAELGTVVYEEPCTLKISEESVTVVLAEGQTVVTPLEEIPRMGGTCTAIDQPREAMGLGDANWMACTGAFLGWKAVLFSLFGGSIIGACVSLFIMLLGRREWAARIPFGPYLAAGALIYLFTGPELINWYLNVVRGMPAEGGL
ncbi:MAG: prepilin peptidase [Verrucomicrobiaceae bacterium]|nr:MAG: prepilin peptidase [Verrucomicrobiaceae bacterium]